MSTVLGCGVGLVETEAAIQGQVQGGKAFRRTKEKGSCRLWNVDPCINAPTQINPISKHLKERTGCLSVILKSLVVVLSKNYRHYFASINLKMWSSTQYKNRETISCYAKVYTIHCSVHCVKISLDVLICWTHPDNLKRRATVNIGASSQPEAPSRVRPVSGELRYNIQKSLSLEKQFSFSVSTSETTRSDSSLPPVQLDGDHFLYWPVQSGWELYQDCVFQSIFPCFQDFQSAFGIFSTMIPSILMKIL